MNRELVEKLKKLRESVKVKDWKEPVQGGITTSEYFITYAAEEVKGLEKIFKPSQTLAISRLDKKPVTLDEVSNRLQEIVQVWDKKPFLVYEREYPNRGHTLLLQYVFDENGNIVSLI